MRLLLIFSLILAALTAACDRRNGISPPDKDMMEVIISAETNIPGARAKSKDDSGADTVYVSLRDATDKVFGLRALVEKNLSGAGKTITANPSAASCIIQIQILAVQKADPQQARDAMNARYGGPIPPEGAGAAMLMADVIFAPRVVPSASSNKQMLASTSTRTIKERSLFRLGIIAPGARRLETAIASMSEKLAEAVSETFNSSY